VGATSALVVAGAWALLFPSDRSACALIALLAGGWWAGYLILTTLLGLHMTPPRSDNWAGCVGLFAALLVYLHRQQNRTAGMATGYGFWIGGIGFVLGNILNMLGRAQWGPVGRYEILHGLDYWKWMEQSFGLIMGLGVGAVFLGWVGPRLTPPAEEGGTRRLRIVALVLLLVVMMWSNLFKNVRNWTTQKQIPGEVLGLGSSWWFFFIGLLLSATVVVALLRYGHQRLTLSPTADFGRGQLLFLLVTWIPTVGAFTQALPGMSSRGAFLVHASFWMTAGLISLIAVSLPPEAAGRFGAPGTSSADAGRLGRGFWIALFLTPIILYGAARLTLAAHAAPLPGSALRFAETISPN
jgi:MFS family permease